MYFDFLDIVFFLKYSRKGGINLLKITSINKSHFENND